MANKIYTIDVNEQLVEKCNDSLCKHQYTYQWFGDKPCVHSFTCTEQEGSLCGNYGININCGKNSEVASEICSVNSLHQNVIEYQETVNITIWYAPQAVFDVSCVMWCTGEGAFPQPVNKTYPAENLATKLVCNVNLLCVPILIFYPFLNR